MNVSKSWAESKDLKDAIVKHENKELEECLLRFFTDFCKSDGSDYEPHSLRFMLAALHRPLKHYDSKIFKAKDREFVNCRQVWVGKGRTFSL